MGGLLSPGFAGTVPSKERPIGITILAGLCLVSGAYTAVGALSGIRVLFLGGPGGMIVYPVHAIIFLLSIAFLFGGGALLTVVGIGLLKLKNWARVLLIAGIGLQALLVARAVMFSAAHNLAFSAFRALLGALVIAGVLAYLFRPQVKEAFGATKR